MSDHRVLEPVEARIMIVAAMLLLTVGGLVALFPKLLTYPMAAVAIWIAGALLDPPRTPRIHLHGQTER
jgi:cardiolipin synthase